jgi:hypothetical protein
MKFLLMVLYRKANDAALKRFEELKISKGIEKNNLCLDKVKVKESLI